MADKKISQLTALAASGVVPSTDVMAIVDTNVTETKKITVKDVVDGALNTQSANGVVYLNGSKEATAGSVISYDGTTFGVDAPAVFNDSGADVDFRIESNTNTHAVFVDAGNSRVGFNTSSPIGTSHVTPPVLSGAIGPVYATGDNVPKKTYLFSDLALTTGQSLRIANTTNVTGRSSALFFCKFYGGNNASNTATNHIYAIFSFRVLILGSGGTASIQGLTSLAAYGITVATDVTFTDNGSGSWHIEIANPTGGTIQTSLEMEVLSYNANANSRLTDAFTSSAV